MFYNGGESGTNNHTLKKNVLLHTRSPMNTLLTPKQAAQKGINFILNKQRQGFVRTNNYTANALASAKKSSEKRHIQQAEIEKAQNAEANQLREKAGMNALISSSIRNEKSNMQDYTNISKYYNILNKAAANAYTSSQKRHIQQAEIEKAQNAKVNQLREKAAANAHTFSRKRTEPLIIGQMSIASMMERRAREMKKNRNANIAKHTRSLRGNMQKKYVMNRIKEYSDKAMASKKSTNAFKPSNAYYIMGHGDIVSETFIVPENCIVVVKVAEGESFFQTDEYISLMCKMDISILKDPIKKKAELVKALGSIAIYPPGATCPNFNYSVIDTIKTPSFSVLSELGSGVTDLEQFKNDESKCALDVEYKRYTSNTSRRFNEMKKRKNIDEIKKIILDAYQYSSYPTPQEVEIEIDKIINNNITDINDIINEMKENPLFRPTQKDLCQKIGKGVFFNFVCRPNNALKSMIKFDIYHNGNKYSITNRLKQSVSGLLTLQNSYEPFQSANNIRTYSETVKYNKLKKAEANLELALKEYNSQPIGNNGSREREAWRRAWYKKEDALEKVNSLKYNKTRKALKSRLEESIAFRKPGVYNMIASTTKNNST